ncbi:hypothetical protein HYW18_03135 [Candidatus Uhrbacteria bacterium]|nr:hypothetical protein [Candidatus Uhrbacteria bacterium]
MSSHSLSALCAFVITSVTLFAGSAFAAEPESGTTTSTVQVDDPTKATVVARLVTEKPSGEVGNLTWAEEVIRRRSLATLEGAYMVRRNLPLVYQLSSGELACNELSDKFQKAGFADWCRANVTVSAGSATVEVTTDSLSTWEVALVYSGDQYQMEGRKFAEEAEEYSNRIRFQTYAGVGTIVLRTSPIGRSIYWGELDSSTLKIGMENVLEVVLHEMPVVEVVTPAFGDPDEHLLEFASEQIVFERRSQARDAANNPLYNAAGNPVESNSALAGYWIVSPGTYHVRPELLAELTAQGYLAMGSMNGRVMPITADSSFELGADSRLVLSVDKAVSK